MTAKRTDKATAATVRRGDDTAAARLRRHGWAVLPPESVAGDLASVVRTAITEAALAYMARRSDLPALEWRADMDHLTLADLRGQVTSDYAEAEVWLVLREWADAFDLAPGHAAGGYVEYTGELDGVTLTVWGVTDRDVFENVKPLHTQCGHPHSIDQPCPRAA